MVSQDLLTPKETGAYLGGIATKTLAQWRCSKAHLSYVKVGGRVFYRRPVLDRFLEKSAIEVGGVEHA